MRTRVNDIPLSKPPGWSLTGKKIMVHDLTAPLSANTILIDVSELQILGLPDQTSNSGKFLTTNGTVASWQTLPTPPDPTIDIDSILPSQTGQTGKVLKTDGTSAYWADDLGTSAPPTLDVVLTEGNTSTKGIALGTDAAAVDTSISVGDEANAGAPGSIAIGPGAATNEAGSLAVGSNAATNAPSSAAIGALANTGAEGTLVVGERATSTNKNEIVLGGGRFLYPNNSSDNNGAGKHSHHIFNFIGPGGTWNYSQFVHTSADIVFQRYTLKVYCINNTSITDDFYIKEISGYRINNTLGDFTEYTASSNSFSGNDVSIALSTDGFKQLKVGVKGIDNSKEYRWTIDWEINELTGNPA
jgi:hypothetical protein